MVARKNYLEGPLTYVFWVKMWQCGEIIICLLGHEQNYENLMTVQKIGVGRTLPSYLDPPLMKILKDISSSYLWQEVNPVFSWRWSWYTDWNIE